MSTNSTVKLYNVSFTESGADFLSSAPAPPTNALTFSTLTPVKLSDKFFKIDITNFNYNDIYAKNYVQITNPDGTYYAYIKGVEWLSYNCVRVDFSLDFWHTYINKCTIKSGFLERSNDKTIPITNRGDISPAAHTTYTTGQRVFTSDNALLVYVSSFPDAEKTTYRYYHSPVPSMGYVVYCHTEAAVISLLNALNSQLERIISIVSIPTTLFGVDIGGLFTLTPVGDTQLWLMPSNSSVINNEYNYTLPYKNSEFFGAMSSPAVKVRLRVGAVIQEYNIEDLEINESNQIGYYVSFALNCPNPSISVKMKLNTTAVAGGKMAVLPPITLSGFPTVPITQSAAQAWVDNKLAPAIISGLLSIPGKNPGAAAVSAGLNIAGQGLATLFDPPQTGGATSADTLFSVNDFGIYLDIMIPTVSERTRIVDLYNYIGFPFNKSVKSLNIFPNDGESYRQTTLKNAVISGNIPDEAREFITNKLSGGVRVWRSL